MSKPYAKVLPEMAPYIAMLSVCRQRAVWFGPRGCTAYEQRLFIDRRKSRFL